MTVPSVMRITQMLMSPLERSAKSAVCEIHHTRIPGSDDSWADRYGRNVRGKETRFEYIIDLTACFTFSITTTLEGPPGLGRDEIEERIEAEWMWISLDTDVLLESSWEIESIKEHEPS